MTKHLLLTEAHLDSAIRFFLYVLIFWLPYSPAVIEICVIMCCLLWLMKKFLTLKKANFFTLNLSDKISVFLKVFQAPPNVLNPYIRLFIFICLLSIVGSVFWLDSLGALFTKTLEWFVIYFFVVETFVEKKHIYTALGIFLFTSLSTSIDSLVQFYITQKDVFLGHAISKGMRPTAGFKTSNDLGAFLTFVAPLFFVAQFIQKRKVFKTISLISLLIVLWVVFITGIRGALVGLFISFLVFLYFILVKNNFKFNLTKTLAASVILIPLVLLFLGYMLSTLESRSQSVLWRVEIWKKALNMILDKPFFGHGINSFMRVFQFYDESAKVNPTYAHNCFIQLAAETGLLGLLSFLIILGQVLITAIRRLIRMTSINEPLVVIYAGIFCGSIAFIIHSFFDTNLYSLQLSSYFWFMIGILFAIENMFNKPHFYGIKMGQK